MAAQEIFNLNIKLALFSIQDTKSHAVTINRKMCFKKITSVEKGVVNYFKLRMSVHPCNHRTKHVIFKENVFERMYVSLLLLVFTLLNVLFVFENGSSSFSEYISLKISSQQKLNDINI